MRNRVNYPLISVIISVYNGEKYIQEALQSVIDQEYPRIEIIVIDDGSTDNTATIVNNFPAKIHYEYQRHQGIATGWNSGVEKAKGFYITFIDADDIWSKEKIISQVEYLEKNPGTDIIFGFAKEFYSPEITGPHTPRAPIPGISGGTMMIRKDKFLEIGFFNTKWRKGIFSDWYLRATEAGVKIFMDETVVLNRRIHDTNHGIVQRDKYVDYVRMLKDSLDRKRKM